MRPTNQDLMDRIDKLEKMVLEANDGSEKLADRLNTFFNNFDGFVKTIKTISQWIFIGGIFWAIFGEKIMNTI